MEFKVTEYNHQTDWYDSINRIRLEFKDNLIAELKKSAGGINRIRLEFKVCWDGQDVPFSQVLIESDWNLKYRVTPVKGWCVWVLIESDWNLKFFVATCFDASE